MKLSDMAVAPDGCTTYPIRIAEGRQMLLVVPPKLTLKDLNRARAFLTFLESSIEDDAE